MAAAAKPTIHNCTIAVVWVDRWSGFYSRLLQDELELGEAPGSPCRRRKSRGSVVEFTVLSCPDGGSSMVLSPRAAFPTSTRAAMTCCIPLASVGL